MTWLCAWHGGRVAGLGVGGLAVAVTRAEFGDVTRLARVVASAVFDVRVSAFLMPDEDDRRRVSAEVARMLYVYPALSAGALWCTADRLAVAGWLRVNPDRPVPAAAQEATELRRLVGRWFPRFERLAEMLAEVHATVADVPHDRLTVLAVHPDRQRRGVGSALLAAHHAYLDGIGRPAYLDAAGPELVGFYARFGYVEVGDPVRLPNRATLHPMWRTPTPTGEEQNR